NWISRKATRSKSAWHTRKSSRSPATSPERRRSNNYASCGVPSLRILSLTAWNYMSDKPFVDTNVLVYTLKKDDPRAWVAIQLLTGGVVVGVQTLNELVHVCLRKLKMPWAETLKAVELVRVLCPSPVPVTMEIHGAALRIVRRFGFNIFDALL